MPCLKAANSRDAAPQGDGFGYGAERRANRDGFRLRGHFERLGFGGRYAMDDSRGRTQFRFRGD